MLYMSIMKSCMFVFLVALLAPPCAGHPGDKAAFLPRGQSSVVGSGDEGTFVAKRVPHSTAALCCEGPGVTSSVLFPPEEQRSGVCAAGLTCLRDSRDQGRAVVVGRTLSCFPWGREGGVERKRKGSISGWEMRFLQHG